MIDCQLFNNSAQMQGGALYVINQGLVMKECNLTNNLAGDASQLFSDQPAAGGAVWYSAQGRNSIIEYCYFSGDIYIKSK
jgi:hypothetical protein